LPAADRDIIHQQVLSMAERGLRVLGVAKGQWKGKE
jgi:Ca2+-transporting ATPase